MLSALMFFPRGGSAHVARALARELPAHGCDVTVVSGSLPGTRRRRALLRGLRRPRGALRSRRRADAPLLRGSPGRAGPGLRRRRRRGLRAPRRRLGARAASDAGAADADVLHLHHLTPIHEAAARVAPGVPVVGHLHGTELLMLERIAAAPPAGWHTPRNGPADAPLGAGLRAPASCSRPRSSSAPAPAGGRPRAASSPPTASTPSASRRGPSTARRSGEMLVDEPRGWARARTRARSPIGPSRRRPSDAPRAA